MWGNFSRCYARAAEGVNFFLLSGLGESKLLHTTAGRGLTGVHISSGIDGQVVQGRGKLSDAGATLAERSRDTQLVSTQDPHFLIGAIGDVEELLIRRKVEIGNSSSS